MKQSFAPLATLSVSHAYFAARTTEIEFVATASTARAMNGAGALARVREGRLHLLSAVQAGSPPQSLAGQTLYFALFGLGPTFSLVTEPILPSTGVPSGALGSTAYFTNRALPVTLDAPAPLALVGAGYGHTPVLGVRPLSLRLSDDAGATLEQRVLSGATAFYDFSAFAPGRYRIDEQVGAQSASLQVFPNAGFASASVPFAILGLTVHASFYSAPPAFQLALAPRAERLRYYVVCQDWTAPELAQLNIADEGAAMDGRDVVHFASVPLAVAESPLVPEQLADAGTGLAVFEAQAVVPLRERGLRRLRLRRDTTTLIEQLPMPSPSRPGAAVIVHLAK